MSGSCGIASEHGSDAAKSIGASDFAGSFIDFDILISRLLRFGPLAIVKFHSTGAATPGRAAPPDCENDGTMVCHVLHLTDAAGGDRAGLSQSSRRSARSLKSLRLQAATVRLSAAQQPVILSAVIDQGVVGCVKNAFSESNNNSEGNDFYKRSYLRPHPHIGSTADE
ncbi:hypothetical protein [uncultured Nitratireductor sp.]|uniref:hypothetical protein n=1 Tax=uncultured Nitratireductor sp. TaxID=520953 RepID=UPI002617DB1F|nr:hypothetical protein [uncultured Nitratireductor sp.]